MSNLVFDDVTFCYPGSSSAVIENMSLEIEDGEAHALLGASGAGKTTLLSLMSGLLQPTAGRILLGGQDVTRENGFQRGIAQVFQFPVVYEGLTVSENLQVPLRAIRMTSTQRLQRVAWLAQELGLDDVLNARPKGLSLYQKQLLAVGKALAREDVAVVLLDEPLTAVEPHIKWSLRQTLRRAQADTGVTMVYVTHDQTEALTFADRVSLLTANGLEQTGTPTELYENPANVYVANFVGSPGMNLLPGSSGEHTRDHQQIGFRPEWAAIEQAVSDTQSGSQTEVRGYIQAKVVSVKPKSTHAGREWGELRLQTEENREFVVAGVTEREIGETVRVQLKRWLSFQDGRNAGQHGL